MSVSLLETGLCNAEHAVGVSQAAAAAAAS